MPRFASLTVLSILMLWLPIQAQSNECIPPEQLSLIEQQTHVELQRLGRDVTNILERVGLARNAGRTIPSGTATDVEELRTELRKLVRTLELGGAGHDNWVSHKIEGLLALVDNASLAVSGGAASPPPRVWADSLDWVVDSGTMAPPSNDNCASAFPLSHGTAFGTTLESTNDGSASCGASMLSPDVWFRFTAPETRRISINTLGSDFDTVLSVHYDCTGTYSNQIICNDDWVGLQSAVAFDAVAGESYLIRIAGAVGATGAYAVELGDGGTVQGRVAHATTSVPIENTYVRLYRETGYSTGGAYTDASGFYAVESIMMGPVFAVADPGYSSPYLDELYDDLSCPGGVPYGCDPTTGTAIPINYGTVTGGIDFGLDRSGSISGFVRDQANGTDILGARVTFYDASGAYVGYAGTGCGTSYYTKTGLEPGIYYAVAEMEGEYAKELYHELPCANGCSPTTGNPIAVSLNNPVNGIDFTLSNYGKITGRVVESSTGTRIDGVSVRAMDDNGVIIEADGTDSDGYFEISGLQTGDYYLLAWDYDYIDQLYFGINCEDWSCSLTDGDPVSVAIGSTATGVNFSLDSMGVIRGQVIDEATGLAVGPIRVELWSESGDYLKSDYVYSGGAYEFTRLDPGAYFVATDDTSAYFNELYDDIPCANGPPEDCVVVTGTPVPAMLNTPTTGIDFALTRRPWITGAVTDEREGSPIAGVTVSAFGVSRLYDRDVTDESGAYQLEGIAPGEAYVVTSNAEDMGFVDELFDDIPCPGGNGAGCTYLQGTPIMVPQVGTVSGIDIALTPMATIGGTVVERGTGSPIAGVGVVIHDTQARVVGTSVTDMTGAYAVGGLIGGSYVASTTNSGLYLDQLYDDIPCPGGAPDGCAPLTGTPIIVEAAGEIGGIDFTLDRGGEIVGTVVAEDSGSAISYAYVYAWDMNEVIVDTDTTDQAGVYVLEGLPPGDYHVSSSKSGYHGELYSQIPCAGGSPSYCDFSLGTLVTVDLATVTTDIDFSLGHGGTVQGMVTDITTGLPISGATIRIYDTSGEYVTSSYSNSGTYSASLSPGTYHLAVTEIAGYDEQLFRDIPIDPNAFNPTIGEAVLITGGATTRHVDFRLSPTGAITGTITDANTGEVVGNNRVELFSSDGAQLVSEWVDGQGRYRIDDLAPGTYYIATDSHDPEHVDQLYNGIPCPDGPPEGCDPTTGTPVVVVSGLTYTIDFALENTATITGEVTSQVNGLALRYVTVAVWDETGQFVSSTSTNNAGIYVINGLETGTYFIATDENGDHIDELHSDIPCPGGPVNGCTPTDGDPVAVTTGAPAAVVDFVLDRLGVIAGVATDAETGLPESGVEMVAFDTTDYSEVADTYTNDTDGSYRLIGLPPGEYVVHARDYYFVDELYDDIPCQNYHCDLSSGTHVSASINTETAGIDVALHRLDGEISGAVTDASTGLPIYHARVEVFSADGFDEGYVHTDENGFYRFIRLAPGDHYVVAEGSGLDYLAELYDDIPCHQGAPMGCDPTKGVPVAVTDGLVSGIDFALEPWQVTGVRGVVTDAVTGLPVPGVYVDIWRQGSNAHYATVSTAIDGSFTRELYADTYFLSTDTNHTYVEELFDDILCPDGPAYQGFCDPFGGTPVEVINGELSDGVDFVLAPGTPTLFSDGFESGDTSNWSGVQ